MHYYVYYTIGQFREGFEGQNDAKWMTKIDIRITLKMAELLFYVITVTDSYHTQDGPGEHSISSISRRPDWLLNLPA